MVEEVGGGDGGIKWRMVIKMVIRGIFDDCKDNETEDKNQDIPM